MALDGPLEVLQMTDFLTHCLALDENMSSTHQQEEQSLDTDAGKTKETNESQRLKLTQILSIVHS